MQTRFCLRVLSGFGALVTAFLLVVPSLGAQQGATITGRVLDAQSGQPISAVQVFISSLDLGGLTQQNGRYLLQNVPAGTHTLAVARIGYRTQEVQVSVAGGQTVEQNFAMAEEALRLDEIIVTGTPGGSQRRAIGNTVSVIDVGDIVQDVAITNIQDLLSGRTGGLRFSRLSGNIGTGSPIIIRGVGSFNQGRNQPLVYVDGIRVNNDEEAGPNLGSGDNVNVLDDFNPEDIESIEIIKGPAAASLYGTEASAGVIQIITKRGAEGAPQFNISIRQGSNFMIDPAGKLGQQWTCPTDDSPGPTDCRTEASLVPYNMYDEGNRYIREGYFDWPTKNLYQNGYSQSYNIDVRGGSQGIRYFVSANYEDAEGIVWYNTDKKIRVRANVDVVMSDRFSLDVSTGYTDGSTRFAAPTQSDGGIWQDLLWSNGHFLDRVTAFDQPGADVRRGGFEQHLPTDVAANEATRDYTRFTGSVRLNFTSPGFSFGSVDGSITSRLILGIDKSWDVNRTLFPLHVDNVPDGSQCAICQDLTQYTSSWSSVDSQNEFGELTYERPIQENLTFDYTVTTSLDYNDTWSFSTSFSAQYYTDTSEFFSNSGQQFASPLSRTINQLSQVQIQTNFSFIESKSLGFYIQEQVSYRDRIFLTAAVRFDDNSTFGVDAPARRYPNFQGTWVVSEESFWNFDAINSLRLRGAWGKAGRQPSATSSQNIYSAISGPAGTSAIRPQSPGNPGIEPEVSTELEVGLDIALFDDVVSGEFTHYWRTDRGALLGISQLGSFGFPGSFQQNLGVIDNWGWEAQLHSRLYDSGSFSFDLDLGADYTYNEIKKLDPTYTGSIRQGLPYPYQQTGDWVVSAQFEDGGSFTNSFGDALNAMCHPGINLAPEGTADVDLQRWGNLPGGDPVDCFTNQNANIFAGPSFSPWSFRVAPRVALLNNRLTIFAMAEGQYGRVREDNGHNWGHIYNNSKVSRLEDDAIWVASQVLNGRSSNDWTKGYYDADFWKLREVGARYTLPESVLGAMGASRATLAVSARNIWTIWVRQPEIFGLPVSDPEYGTSSLSGDGNFWETPAIANINVVLRITF